MWPLKVLIPCYLAGIIWYGAIVPNIDGSASSKIFLVGLSILYWCRVLLAYLQKENNKGYIFYIIILFLSPFIWAGIVARVDGSGLHLF